ncbi:MAG: amidohydrolase [Rubrivivax sp.]|nr:amidohydrolase [Rubrivivax sp.]
MTLPALPALPEVREVADEMVALRRQIHAHPELGFEEHRTSELVASRLERWGYEVTRGVGRTGVVGRLRVGSGTRSLGLRADMDALPITEQSGLPHASLRPGLMHACGHDGHTATLLAAARVLALTRGFSGTLNLVFQPAEEGLGGAQAMLDDGLFERFPCDRLFGFHNSPGAPAGKFGIRAGVVYSSSDTAVITLRGRGGHGAKPHLAVDPIVAASHLIIALQSIVSREVHPNELAIVTVGAFHAGDAPNVIPASAELRLTIRARSEAVRAQLRDRITAMAHAQAAVHGATADVDYRWRYPVTINDEAATAFVRETARELAGDDALIPDWPPGTASDDMGLFLQRVPGCYFNVGNGTDETPGEGGCPVHNAGYDFNDRILPSTASLFVRLAQRYLVES